MDDRSDTALEDQTTQDSLRVRYQDDLYSWAVQQSALLRAGRIAEADARNIAEELDDVRQRQYDRLEDSLRIILLHILKWDHEPERRSRSWRTRIVLKRNQVARVLRKNAGLKAIADGAVADAYETARIEAAEHTLLEPDTFPVDCPYTWGEIMQREISWPPRD